MAEDKLARRLEALAAADRHRFHMPGHKGRGLPLAAWDVTEIPGADNLHDAADIIAGVQDDLTALYGSVESHLLVGGTTAGNTAAILAAVNPGEAVLVPANSHRSVFSALALGRIPGRFIRPEADGALGFYSQVTAAQVEAALEAYPDIGGMVLTNPTYFGTASDTAAIAGVLHRRGKWLIVDEAHGAHLAFCQNTAGNFPADAVTAGADVVVQSTHKILSAYTQGSLIHRCSDRISGSRLRAMLSVLQSSSPSYLLMAGIEHGVREAAEIGAEKMGAIAAAWDGLAARQDPAANIRLYVPEDSVPYDKSKWLFTVKDGRGKAIGEAWRRDYGVFCEIEAADYILAMTGMGTEPQDLAALTAAVDGENTPAPVKSQGAAEGTGPIPAAGTLNQMRPLWQVMMDENREWASLSQCTGRIAADFVIPYPPGSPVILPGDAITADLAVWLERQAQAGRAVIGVEDGAVSVLK